MTVLVNRAKMSTATTGTGSITLGSAVDGYQSFSAAGVSNADVVRYVIEDGSNWEIGTGTYSASGTALTRTVSESSNAGAAISLSGAATIFVGATAEDIPSVTAGSLTKSFSNGETANISLSRTLSPAPVVSVTKEVAQLGFSNGDWDIVADGSNYEIEDHAYAVDLSVSTGAATITLSSGSWSSDDLGRRVVGNSGEVVITSVDASVAVYDYASGSDFANDNTITSGNWSLFGLKFISSGVTLPEGTFEEVSIGLGYKIDSKPVLVNSFSVSGQDISPNGIAFNNDGTKMYMVGSNTDSVYQYSLSTAFNVSTASYDSVSFSISGQDSSPYDIAFSNDGTKMYMVGISGDRVYQYGLSTAFDLSTASYDGVSFSVAGQDGLALGIAFNNDGTKMYMVGATSDRVYQYSLSTAFNVSTASYDSVNFSVSNQDGTPYSIAFNNDGTKMYIVGANNDSVHEYNLSTAFNLSTASYGNVSFNVSAQDSVPNSIAFNNDGTKMYIAGSNTDSVYEYQLNVPFFVDDAPIPYVSFSVSGQDLSPYGIAFNNDGTKMYMVGSNTDSVYQYSLSTAFNVSTASYDSVSFSVSGQDSSPYDIAFSNDGTKMYMVGSSTDRVCQYSLSTAFDLSTASYDSVSFSVSGQDSFPTDIAFNNDGTKMYMAGNSNDSVYQYSLSTAFDLSTASYDSVSFSVSGQDSVPTGIAFNNDGTKMYMAGNSNDSVYQYTLSTAFDLSTASYDSVSFSVSNQDGVPYSIAFNNDGTKMYMVGSGSDSVYEYRLAGPYSIQPKYAGNSFYVGAEESSARCVIFNNNGTKMYIAGGSYKRIRQYSLAKPFNVTTASYDGVYFSFTAQDSSPYDLAFNADGTKMYMIGGGGDSVYQYSLSTGFDVSTVSYDSVSFSIAGQETNPHGIAFNTDGTKMYIVGSSTDSAYQYTLSTAFDLSTASYDSVSLALSSQDVTPIKVRFNDDGTKLFVLGHANDTVFQYNLTTAFDLGTASYSAISFAVANQDASVYGLAFSNNGSKMYVTGNLTDRVYEYDVGFGTTVITVKIVPASQYFAAVTNSSGQIDSTNWADLNSMTASEALSGANAYYAVSIDGSTFNVIHNTNGERSIARDNSGTWQYNSNAAYASETWVNATRNSVQGAIEQSMSVAVNKMDSTQLQAVTDPNHYTLGNTLDLAIVLHTSDSERNPVSDGVDINYDAAALNQGAILGTDYDYEFPDSTTVKLTSNAAQNLKIRVV